MDVFYKDKKVIAHNIEHFNIAHTFECGQCFRWNIQQDKSYTGIAFNKVINVKFNDNKFIISNTNIDDFNNIWKHYFDLERDYGIIKEKLYQDDIIKTAGEFGWGIHILKQDIWECLISFIISANNSIHRIKNIIKNISKLCGKPLYIGDQAYYSFPGPEDICNLSSEDLLSCGSGYRHKYILDAAHKVLEGSINLENLKKLSTNDARDELMKIYGVGPKVSDCILLFSLQKHNVFPTDVWIKKIMGKLYFGTDTAIKDIQVFAAEKYGSLAGFAQQYLFYYARENLKSI